VCVRARTHTRDTSHAENKHIIHAHKTLHVTFTAWRPLPLPRVFVSCKPWDELPLPLLLLLGSSASAINETWFASHFGRPSSAVLAEPKQRSPLDRSQPHSWSQLRAARQCAIAARVACLTVARYCFFCRHRRQSVRLTDCMVVNLDCLWTHETLPLTFERQSVLLNRSRFERKPGVASVTQLTCPGICACIRG
jgi:hypothetical protein